MVAQLSNMTRNTGTGISAGEAAFYKQRIEELENRVCCQQRCRRQCHPARVGADVADV
jgi:hypothetical protein